MLEEPGKSKIKKGLRIEEPEKSKIKEELRKICEHLDGGEMIGKKWKG
jgi:hypothetical protein